MLDITVTPREQDVLSLAQGEGTSSVEVRESLQISEAEARKILAGLRDRGLLFDGGHFPHSRMIRWILPPNTVAENDDKTSAAYLILGEKMKEVAERARIIAATHIPVVILGETGVGKEGMARIIHASSERTGPFVAVNCAQFLNKELLGSELFGHEAGSFTGATGMRRGVFESANRGTIFLDEVSDLPLDVQSALLRILDIGTFTRVGGNHEIRTDLRIVSATNKNLKNLVDSRKFREDLFYRIRGYLLKIPPLRERRGEILPFAEHFLHAGFNGTSSPRLSGNAKKFLVDYSWPGNIRELKSLLTVARELASDGTLTDTLLAELSEDPLSV